MAEKLGYAAGLQLMATLGGSQLSIPAKPTPAKGSALSRALGEDAARVMVEMFGGEHLEIPVGRQLKRDDQRRAILEHVGTNNEVARELGVSRRWVRMVRAGAVAAKRAALRAAFQRDAPPGRGLDAPRQPQQRQ